MPFLLNLSAVMAGPDPATQLGVLLAPDGMAMPAMPQVPLGPRVKPGDDD